MGTITKYNAEEIIKHSFTELEALAEREKEIRNGLVGFVCSEVIEYTGQDDFLMEVVDGICDGKFSTDEAMSIISQKHFLDDFPNTSDVLEENDMER